MGQPKMGSSTAPQSLPAFATCLISMVKANSNMTDPPHQMGEEPNNQYPSKYPRIQLEVGC
jgi:hypothetical protein